MPVLPVGFAQGHQPIAFQRHDEVLLPRLLEVFHVFRGGEPDVGQYPREFQPVLDAGIHHRPHLLILGDLATPLFLTGLDVAIMDRFAHQLEGHREGCAVRVVKAVQQVDTLDVTALTVVIMPADQLVFVHVGFFFHRIIHDQHPIC